MAIANYGNKDTGEVKKRELRFRTHNRQKGSRSGWNFDEPDPKTTWWCENEEIERVLSFLQSEVSRTGRYRLVDAESSAGLVLELLRDGAVDPHAIVDALMQHGDIGELASLLAVSDSGLSVAQLAVVAKRRSLIAELQAMIQHPATTETQVQRLIGHAYWIFGGRYVGVARRNMMPLDQHDIPLLGADGTLHIVELKGPFIEKLVRLHRNHWIVGDEVHEAVGQAMSYVRAFDELGSGNSMYYQNELGQNYDMRRVFATVVIGHPRHARIIGKGSRPIEERVVQQTIRSYNAHLSRVEVITYRDLADTAERALAFENESMLVLPSEDPSTEPTVDQQDGLPVDADQRSANPWSDEPPF
ncbi:MAG: DUF4263 domain-containing protein [Actinomycetota bacterium]|nr:DUF4263 domain-containing protein [Actinomycetota bacterium]